MTQDDSILQRFYAAEREREGAAAPPFSDLMEAIEPSAPPTVGERPRWRGFAFALASVAAAAVVLSALRDGSPDASTRPPGSDPSASAASPAREALSPSSNPFDEACDAALAALDAHALDDGLVGGTDVLLNSDFD